MDERTLEAWTEITDRRNDPESTQIMKVSRSDLGSLVDEILRLREELAKCQSDG